MNRRAQLRMLLAAIVAITSLLQSLPADAGLTDKLKKKAQQKAEQKTDEAADKALGSAEGAASGGTEAEGASDESSGPEPSANAGASDNAKVSEVSTKFDFVPGDKVLFADDFARDELGEFPARWTLSIGTFEVAEMAGERWMRSTGDDGTVSMKLPATASLPEFWTLEFDFFGEEPMGSALTVSALVEDGRKPWEITFPVGDAMTFRSGDVFSSTKLEGSGIAGRHHVMIMARGAALKAYIDRQRLVNAPDISAYAGMPATLEIRLWAQTHPMITNVRFAEGPKPAKDLLAEGKLVTYGIHFASGSDVVRPESAPVLRQIAAYLESNAAVKLRITGHTDNTGTAAGNLDLSQRRAASVARVLSDQFKLAADRFATDGKGDTETVASNDTVEGRAMNRRVEFTKL
jgi:outer membrane protein OmpA-like peptidoglycan-associated protein